MSTRSTLKHHHDPLTGVGFSLITDWLDECAGADVVHLSLNGVTFSASAGLQSVVEIGMPREIAVLLGLLPGYRQEAIEAAIENVRPHVPHWIGLLEAYVASLPPDGPDGSGQADRSFAEHELAAMRRDLAALLVAVT